VPFPAQTDVIVVGAGAAGLMAAHSLVSRGVTVTVVEATDRVGGRLLSVPAGDGHLDLGATWFWPNEPRIQVLLQDLGLATHDQYLEGDAVFQDPRGVQRLRGNPVDVASGRFTSGAQSLAASLAATLPEGTIRLGTQVTRIAAGHGDVMTETSAGTLRAKQLILAVPPALAAATIDIPDLDPLTADIARATPVWMGAVTKVVAHYAEPFWRDRGLAGAAMSHVGPMREVHDMSGPGGSPAALFGFVPPTAPGRPALAEAEVVRQLAALYGPEAERPIRLFIKEWRTERFTSPPGVEALQAYDLFGHPCYQVPALGGLLHWASTETSPGWPGHIEGALLGGDRAAAAVVTSLVGRGHRSP